MRLNPWFAIPVAAAGVAGYLIGGNVARVACAPVEPGTTCDPGGWEIVFGVIGAMVSVIGVAIVLVLVIRSLAEWREQSHRHD